MPKSAALAIADRIAAKKKGAPAPSKDDDERGSALADVGTKLLAAIKAGDAKAIGRALKLASDCSDDE